MGLEIELGENAPGPSCAGLPGCSRTRSSVTFGVPAWLPAEGGHWSVLELEGLW